MDPDFYRRTQQKSAQNSFSRQIFLFLRRKKHQKTRERAKEILVSRTFAIFQVETNLPLGKEEIDLSNDTILQIAEKVENFSSKDVNFNTNLQGGCIDISSGLHRVQHFVPRGLTREFHKHTETGPNVQVKSLRASARDGTGSGRELTVGICVAMKTFASPALVSSFVTETTRPDHISSALVRRRV